MIKRLLVAVLIVVLLTVGMTAVGARVGSGLSFVEPRVAEAWSGTVTRCYLLRFMGGGGIRYCIQVGFN